MFACLLALASVTPQAAPLPQNTPLPQGIAVVWRDRSVTETEFGAWISSSLGRGHEAVQEALRHLLQIRLVEHEAAAHGLTVKSAAVDARFEEARIALENAGMKLKQELAARGMSESEFRKLLGDSLLHEQLVRKDLGLETDAPVSAEQLQAWSDQRLAALLASPLPASPEFVVAVGTHRVTRVELGDVLLRTTPADRLRDLAGQRALEEALPAWGAERGVTLPDSVLLAEIEWRRQRVAQNPNYQGATYEGLLSTRGITLDDVLAGAELRVTGWLRLYSAEIWSDAWFEALAAEERSEIESEFGATRRVSWLLLHATERKASELDLDYAEAAAELESWAGQASTAEAFGQLAGKYSEHAPSQRRNGELGLVHQLEPGIDPLLLGAAFVAPVGVLHGPVKVQGGMALLWVQEELPAPTPAEQRAAYRRARHEEAQEKFLAGIGLRTRWDSDAR